MVSWLRANLGENLQTGSLQNLTHSINITDNLGCRHQNVTPGELGGEEVAGPSCFPHLM